MKINIIKKNKFNLFFVFLALFYLFCFEILNCRKNKGAESKVAKSLIIKQSAYKPEKLQINFNNKKKKKGSRSLYLPKKSNDGMGGKKKTQIKKSGKQLAIQGQSKNKSKSQIKKSGLKKVDQNKKNKKLGSKSLDKRSSSSGSSSGSGSQLSQTNQNNIDKEQVDIFKLEQIKKKLEEDKKNTELEINKLKEEEEKNKIIANDKKNAFEQLIEIKKEIEKNPNNEKNVKKLKEKEKELIAQAKEQFVNPRSIKLSDHKEKGAYDPVFTSIGNLSAAELTKIIEENEKNEKNQALIRDKKIKELNKNAQKISLQIDDNKQKQITRDNIFMETIQEKDPNKIHFEIYLNNNQLKESFKGKTIYSFVFNSVQSKFHENEGFLVEEDALLPDLSDALKKDNSLNDRINVFISAKNACFVGLKKNRYAVLINKENGFEKFAVAAGLIKDDNLKNKQLQEQKQMNQQNKLQIHDNQYDKDLSLDQKRLKEECLKYYNEQYEKPENENLILYGLIELNKKLKIKQQGNRYTKDKQYVQPCYFESMLPLAIIYKKCKRKEYVDRIVDFFVNSNLANFLLGATQLSFDLIIYVNESFKLVSREEDLKLVTELGKRRLLCIVDKQKSNPDAAYKEFSSFNHLESEIKKTVNNNQSIILKSKNVGHYTLNINGVLIPDGTTTKQKTLDYYRKSDGINEKHYNFVILPIFSYDEISKILNIEYDLKAAYKSFQDDCMFIGGYDKIEEAIKNQEQNRKKQEQLMKLIIEEEDKQAGGGGQKNLQQQQQQQNQQDDENITFEQIMKQEPLLELKGKKKEDYNFLFEDNGKYIEEEHKAYGEFSYEESNLRSTNLFLVKKDEPRLLNIIKYIDHKGNVGKDSKLIYFIGPNNKYYYATTNQFCLNDKFEPMYEDLKKNPKKYNNNVEYVLNERAKRHCGDKTKKDYFARMKEAIMLKIIEDQKNFSQFLPKPMIRPGNACSINAIAAALIIFKKPKKEAEYLEIEKKVLNSDLFKISIPDEGIDFSLFKLKNDPENKFFNFCINASYLKLESFDKNKVYLIKGESHFSIGVGDYDNGCYIDSNAHKLSNSSFKNLSNYNNNKTYFVWELDLEKVESFLSYIKKYPYFNRDFIFNEEIGIYEAQQKKYNIFLG